MCPPIASAAAPPTAATAAAPAAAPSAAPTGSATFEELWLGSSSLDSRLPLARGVGFGFVTRMQESARVAVATVAAILEVPAHLRAAVGGVDGGLSVLEAAVVAARAVAVAKGEAMIWFLGATRALGLIAM